MFTEADKKNIEEKGLTIKDVEKQIERFKKGFPYLKIIKPATIEEGIYALDADEIKNYVFEYENSLKDKDVLKFVPASGAATRMFKHLYAFLNDQNCNDPLTIRQLSSGGHDKTAQFIENIDNFAFYNDLEQVFRSQQLDLRNEIASGNYNRVVNLFLNPGGLGYGNLPKGLLKFHLYQGDTRTPIEEHMVEGAEYCRTKNKVSIHFTVSPEHQESFEKLVASVSQLYEKHFNCRFEISYSQQKPSTDTVAVDPGNKPFRQDDGSILFRPGGHGSLIENLNELNADLIFIKNIDNVLHDDFKADTYLYKKALGGILFYYQKRIFDYLRQLTSMSGTSDVLIEEIGAFVQNELFIHPKDEFQPQTKSQQIAYLINRLNRPVRVCGMVKNQGEPGGGPFWAVNPDNTVSLQIVEASQFNPDDEMQQKILKSSTHFNPVDIVCSTKDINGNKFDLTNFVDPDTGFISKKSKDGRDLKALERPGLWNGAMSGWITIFVEVPVSTFSPVKTINDLLKNEHQPAL